MKYSYIILLGLLAIALASFAESMGVESLMTFEQQQEITVKGQIVDDAGEPLPGATVQQKDSNNGTISDIDGNFPMSVPEDATLVVSFIGFQSTEIAVGGRTNLGSVTMLLDISELGEVVVIGYGAQRKVDLTGSVAIVDTDEMKKVSNSKP